MACPLASAIGRPFANSIPVFYEDFFLFKGLQMGFFLERAGRDYIILERDSSAGITNALSQYIYLNKMNLNGTINHSRKLLGFSIFIKRNRIVSSRKFTFNCTGFAGMCCPDLPHSHFPFFYLPSPHLYPLHPFLTFPPFSHC